MQRFFMNMYLCMYVLVRMEWDGELGIRLGGRCGLDSMIYLTQSVASSQLHGIIS